MKADARVLEQAAVGRSTLFAAAGAYNGRGPHTVGVAVVTSVAVTAAAWDDCKVAAPPRPTLTTAANDRHDCHRHRVCVCAFSLSGNF